MSPQFQRSLSDELAALLIHVDVVAAIRLVVLSVDVAILTASDDFVFEVSKDFSVEVSVDVTISNDTSYSYSVKDCSLDISDLSADTVTLQSAVSDDDKTYHYVFTFSGKPAMPSESHDVILTAKVTLADENVPDVTAAVSKSIRVTVSAEPEVQTITALSVDVSGDTTFTMDAGTSKDIVSNLALVVAPIYSDGTAGDVITGFTPTKTAWSLAGTPETGISFSDGELSVDA